MLVLIMVCAIIVPLDLGLGGLEGEDLELLNLIILTCFSCDILLNFHTSYYDSDGCLEKRHCKVIKKYLKGWFCLDIISTFPFDSVLTSFEVKGTTLARLPRIVKMVRLVRLMRLAKVQAVIENTLGVTLLTNVLVMLVVKFLTLFVALLLISHWLACVFCAFAALEELQHIEDDFYGGERKVGWKFDGVHALDMSLPERYRVAFYFTFCCLLMGKPKDIGFETSHCRYFFMLFGFIKPIVGATIVGGLMQMILKQNTKKGQLQQKKATLGIFMQQNKILKSTIHQVFAYLEHADQQMESVQELEAIKGLSPTLRDEIAYQTLGKRIGNFSLFMNAFGKNFARHLCSVLKIEHFGPDDMVYQTGHIMSRMVFVDTGTLVMFQINSSVRPAEEGDEGSNIIQSGTIEQNQCFGGQCLFLEGARSTETVLCLTFSELTFLSATDFKSVVSQNPMWGSMMRVVQETLREHPALAQDLHSGNCGPLEDVLPAEHQQQVRNRWGVARKSISTLKMFAPKGDAQDASRDREMTSGFHSMQMSTVERCMMNELKKISQTVEQMSKRQEALSSSQNQIISKQDVMSQRISTLDKRIDKLSRSSVDPESSTAKAEDAIVDDLAGSSTACEIEPSSPPAKCPPSKVVGEMVEKMSL